MAGKPQPAGRERALRFAWLSDLHLSAAPDLRAYRRRFAEAADGARAAAPEFTLVTGDLVEQSDRRSYALFRRLLRDLPAPVYFLPGNHDVGEKRFDAAPPGTVVTADTLARYRDEAGPTWHRFDAAGYRFLALTSSLFGSGLPEEAEQWEWLEREIAAGDGAPGCLVFHHPLYLDAPDEPGGTYWNVEPQPRERLLRLTSRHGIRAVFTGHIHRSLRHRYNGTALLTQTAVSFGLGAPDQRVEGWSLVTLRGAEPEIAFHRLTPGGTIIREED
jgi:3',5'-cyclic AMP phosphodiesterase CpdA